MANDALLKSVLANAIVEFCQRQCLYVTELTIQGTVCVTTDNSSILVTQIAEKIVDKGNTVTQDEVTDREVTDDVTEVTEQVEEVVASSTPTSDPQPAWYSPTHSPVADQTRSSLADHIQALDQSHAGNETEVGHVRRDLSERRRDVVPPSSLPLFVEQAQRKFLSPQLSTPTSPTAEPGGGAVVVKKEVLSPAFLPDFAALSDGAHALEMMKNQSPTSPLIVGGITLSPSQAFITTAHSPSQMLPRKKARTNIIHTNIAPEDQRSAALAIIEQRRYKQYQSADGSQFECPVCSHVYKTQPQFRVHLESRHVGVRIECELCKVTFQSLEGLSTHRRRNHPEQLRHVCDICTERYYDYYALLQHRSRKHNIMGVTNRSVKRQLQKVDLDHAPGAGSGGHVDRERTA